MYLELSQWCCDTSPCINQLTLSRHKRQRPLCIGARAGGGERAVSEPAPRRNGGYKENIVWCHYWYYDLRYPHPPPPSSTKYQIDKNRMKRTAHYFIYIQPVPRPSISWKIEEKSSIISFPENFSHKMSLIYNRKESYVFRGVEISSVINKYQR